MTTEKNEVEKFFVIDHNIEKGIPTIFSIIPKKVSPVWMNGTKAYKMILDSKDELIVEASSFFSDEGKAIEALREKFKIFSEYVENIVIFKDIEKNVIDDTNI